MRFRKASPVFTAVFLSFTLHSSFLQAAERGISGRLIFENTNYTCDQQCTVTLLASGVRPVQTVSAGIGGRFTFTGVANTGVVNGPYSIRVEVDGFEPVVQELDGFDVGYEVTVMVRLVRKGAAPSGGGALVDVSEFLERYPKKAVSYFEKGVQSLKKEKNEEAVKYLRNAVELAPTFYEAHNQLGVAYRESGRMDDAENEFLLAHQLNSTSVEPLLNLTRLYLDENEPDRAVDVGEQAVKANSHSASAFFNLGVALYKAAQLDRAEAALKRALALAPKLGNIRLMLANVYLKLQRYDKSVEQLNSYIAENPKGAQRQEAVEMRDRLVQAGVNIQP